MSPAAPTFADLVLACRRELLALAPQAAAPQLVRQTEALATIMALCRCRLTLRRRTSAISASIACRPAPCEDAVAISLLKLAEDAMTRPFSKPEETANFRVEVWIAEHGFLSLVIGLVRARTPLISISALVAHVAVHVRTLGERFRFLGTHHCSAIIRRDVGALPYRPQRGLSRVLHWALAPDFVGKRVRRSILAQRRQALDIYGALASVLIEPDITRAIDAGEPLNDRLTDRLNISEAHLRRLRDWRAADYSLAERTDSVSAVRMLVLHEVPLHQWPTGMEWDRCAWRDCRSDALFRPDYAGQHTGQWDAIEALKADLLGPLAAECAVRLGLAERSAIRYFVGNFAIPPILAHGSEHRDWLSVVREAVIGCRGIKSFEEATQRWHRRAATIAALRHEEQVEAPGWPALCPPWCDDRGQASIVVLASAEDLVDEGTALDHCVGGYYVQCRTGSTQILSMRIGELRCATIELLVEPVEGGGLAIRLGQFKGHRNSKPERQQHEVLRAFLEDLRSGRHPVAAREIATYRRQMAVTSDYAWRSGPLSMTHARRAWPLYRTMLPKGSPEAFDAWCETTGLTAAFDAILNAIASAAP